MMHTLRRAVIIFFLGFGPETEIQKTVRRENRRSIRKT